jgi:hypothetical protein
MLRSTAEAVSLTPERSDGRQDRVTRYPTSLDVVDHLTDGYPVEAISEGRCDLVEILEAVRGFYGRWTPPPARTGEIRVLPATRTYRGSVLLPARAVAFTDAELASRDATYEGEGWIGRQLRRTYTGAFLYADSVVELDPVSFLLHSSYNVKDLPLMLLPAVFELVTLRPLIEAGVLLLAPVPGNDEWNDDARAARSAAQPVGGRGYIELAHMFSALRVAATMEADVVATPAVSWASLGDVIANRHPQPAPAATVAAGLATVELPIFAGVTPRTILRIRADEESFAEWRAELRQVARLVAQRPSDGDFALHARAAYEDLLIPKARTVARAVSRSHALKSAAKDQPLQTAFGAALTSAGATLAGLPIEGALISAAGGALGRLAASGVRRPAVTGSARVLAELSR